MHRLESPHTSSSGLPPLDQRCKYPSKYCHHPRAVKANGDLHRFCEYHRVKANLNQQRWSHTHRGAKTTSTSATAAASDQPPPADALLSGSPSGIDDPRMLQARIHHMMNRTAGSAISPSPPPTAIESATDAMLHDLSDEEIADLLSLLAAKEADAARHAQPV